MKTLFYAIYSIDNHSDFSLSLVQLGFKTKAEAIKIINGRGGKCIIMEYYE